MRARNAKNGVSVEFEGMHKSGSRGVSRRISPEEKRLIRYQVYLLTMVDG